MPSANQKNNPSLNSCLPAQVEAALARGATVVTANQRSARTLRLAFTQLQHNLKRTVWTPPDILSWSAWTASLWQRLLLDGVEERLLLSALQEHAIWKDILLADRDLKTLQRHDELAKLAQSAYGLLAAHQGLHRLRECSGSLDAETFLRWAIEFERRCKKERWLPQPQLESALCAALTAGSLALGSAEFALIGFARMTPAQDALRNALHASGSECHSVALSVPVAFDSSMKSKSGRRVIVTAEDPDAEVRAAAWWARAALKDNPQARIAIILPDIASRRSQVERIFQRVLAPELTFINSNVDAIAGQPAYEFSLGFPLASEPMVAAALSILRWVAKPLPLDHVSRLLLSPFVGDGSRELQTRASFDANTLRTAKILQPKMALDWLIEQLQQEPRLSGLRQHLIAVWRLAQEYGVQRPQKKSHTEWAECMGHIVAAAGWPGTRPLNSSEYQLLQKWQEALDQVCALDFTSFDNTLRSSAAGSFTPSVPSSLPRVEYNAVLDAVLHLASDTLFAPESRYAPIQIMGVLESSGSLFDAVWFMGATDSAWPATGRTAPLLPWRLQRSLHMPHADASQDYELARSITLRVASSAPVVSFSYAEQDGKMEFRPSPLLSEVANASPACEHLRAEALIQEEWLAALPGPELEEFDAEGDIAPTPDTVLRGGAHLLKLQSLCPFRAFAEQRLASTEIGSIESGFDAMERGNLVHSVLERFWNLVRDQEKLASMPDAERRELLSSMASEVLQKEMRPTTAWDKAYLGVQQKWLVQLLEQWLAQEVKRPFFKVLSNEAERREVHIGSLRLRVRPDRVDLVNEGNANAGEVILDYKTGKCSRKDWEGDRPEEPQLPLYATLADPEKLAGIAFAQVRAGDMCLQGYATAPGILKATEHKANGELKKATEVRENLHEQVAEWRRILESRADEFHRGVASVTPKNYPKTCEHCGQRPFCRVSESPIASGSPDTEDNEVEEYASQDGANE